jgi:hypothetical protein
MKHRNPVVKFLIRAVEAFAFAVNERPHPRTLCCDVEMVDVWQHAERCPNFQAEMRRVREHGGKPPLRRKGDGDKTCPTCGFPTKFFGIYVVGEKCPWCKQTEPTCP